MAIAIRADPLPQRRRFSLRAELRPRSLGVVMNLPTLITLGLVLAYPIGYAAYLSFHKVSLAELRRGVFPFVGLANYQRIFADPLFLLALKNTFVFVGISVLAEVVLAVAIALLIDQRAVWTGRITKFLILVPYAVPPIANGLVWAFLYDFQFGFLNRVLFALGLIDAPINWAGDPSTALVALTVPYVWRTLPFAILLVHAALQGLNPELYEAAEIDGAGIFRRFRHITLPQMRFLLLVLLLLQVIATMQVFTEPYLLTGTTDPSTITVMVLVYRYAFSVNQDIGLAAAMSMILFAVLAVLSAVYLWLTRARTP
jgi:ABC-type sugar transport system permease subunit